MVKYKRRYEIRNISEEEEFEAGCVSELIRLIKEVECLEGEATTVTSKVLKD